MEQMATVAHVDAHEGAHAEAASYFPSLDTFRLGPEEYLEQIRRIKQAVDLPLIGSLNGATPGGWLDFAGQIAEAGADALELNVYFLAADPEESGEQVEKRILEMVSGVKKRIRIPVAVKLSAHYTALANFARQLVSAGADGLVLFNRFYQPDIDVEELEVSRRLRLSDSKELPLRLRWLAILSGRIETSLAVSGGVHTPIDAIKAVMTGAHAVQMVSALLERGPEYLGHVKKGVAEWLEEHEYESLRQMLGSMNLERSPDPSGYERANYMEILQMWEA